MSFYVVSLNDPFNPGFKKEVIDLIEQIILEHERKPGKKSEETSTKQQILILNYLEIILKINLENTKKALLFSKLLNRNEENLRKYLTYVDVNIEYSDLKTKDNLEAVRKIFEEVGLTDAIKLVKKDLEKIDKMK